MTLVKTIGHSTRSLDDFIALLKANQVDLLVDVRTIPRSKHNPQYNADSLPESLMHAGMGYTHMAGLGGLRKPQPDSPNMAWRNDSFRGFADYMQTAEFRESLDKLVKLAGEKNVAVMCAEAVPWRCHRSLISDALTVRGLKVEHIVGAGGRKPHRLTPWAKVEDLRVTYPAIP